MSQWLVSSTLILSVLVLSTLPVRAGEPAPTNAEVVQQTTEELTKAFDEGLPAVDGEGRRISLRPETDSAFNSFFEDALAPRLLDRGFDVWVLEAGEEPEKGSLLMEYKVLQATLRYPKQVHGFLGFGTPKIKRQVDLQVEAKVEEPGSGHVLWMETPEAHYKDSFPVSQKNLVETDQPEWLGTGIAVESGSTSKVGFWEKITILALIGGVVTLYISGAG